MPTAGHSGSPVPSTRSAHSHGSMAPSSPSRPCQRTGRPRAGRTAGCWWPAGRSPAWCGPGGGGGSGGGSAFGGARPRRPVDAGRQRPRPLPVTAATSAATGAGRRRLDAALAASSSREPVATRQRAGLHDRAVGEHHDLVAAAHRGQPVRDDDADAAAQQPFGRPLHLASVTGSSRAVASSRITTCGSRTRMRANATSCSCPADSM